MEENIANPIPHGHNDIGACRSALGDDAMNVLGLAIACRRCKA